jgi:hypothetical protein
VDADILRLTENDVQARRTADALVARISNGYPVPAFDRDFGDLALCETSALGQIDRRSLTTVGRHAWPE